MENVTLKINGQDVTVPANYPLLHQNGCMFWIQRDLSYLATEGRPLSENGKLHAMYEVRNPLYTAFSDHSIINDATPEDVVQKLLSIYTEDNLS